MEHKITVYLTFDGFLNSKKYSITSSTRVDKASKEMSVKARIG